MYQLRKVIGDCKDSHMRKLYRAARKSVDRRKSSDANSHLHSTTSGPRLSLDPNNVPRPSVDSQARSFTDPEDHDIDFDFDERGQDFGAFGVASSNGTSANSLDLVMRQPLHMAMLQYGKQNPSPVGATGPHPNAPVSPFPHNTISRVFVNTIGRLGRWKRVLNSRATVHVQPSMTAGVDVSAFDVEANETGDLLLVKGGVEQYLRMVESQMNVSMFERPSTATAVSVSSPRMNVGSLPQSPKSPSSMIRVLPAEDLIPPPASIPEDEEPESEETAVPPADPPSYEEAAPFHVRDSIMTYDSEIHSIYGDQSDYQGPATPADFSAPPKLRHGLDVVSIDDMDLSDLSSDEHMELSAPPGLGLKKATRKLPTRRDFEFVRQSMSSVSSMGIQTRESMLSQEGSSVVSSSSEVDPDAAEAAALQGGPLQAWQINAILDSLSDEEESGDVEAALRRLEGQINQDKVKEKQTKVDQWIQSMHQRQADSRSGRESEGSGSDEDYGEVERRRFSGDSAQEIRVGMSATSPQARSRRSSFASVSQVPSTSQSTTVPSTTATSPEHLSIDTLQVPADQGYDADALTPLSEARPFVEDAVPIEILQSRVESRPSTSHGSPSKDSRVGQPLSNMPPPQGIPSSLQLRRHHSFVLNYRAETLMQHLSMIDRELFISISFEELITSHSIGEAEDANVLDWSHFLRERARLKAEGRSGSKTSALMVVRGRFNLLANFVLSEIVLTHPSERAVVINKFIRLAWVRVACGHSVLIAFHAKADGDMHTCERGTESVPVKELQRARCHHRRAQERLGGEGETAGVQDRDVGGAHAARPVGLDEQRGRLQAYSSDGGLARRGQVECAGGPGQKCGRAGSDDEEPCGVG